MDLAWLNLAIGSQDALNALEILSPRQLPQPGIDAETWVRAFEALHHGDEVYEILIGTAGHQRKVRSRKELDEGAEAGEPLERAIGALAWGAPAEIVGCEISAPLAPHEDAAYLAVVATETPAARKHVLDLIKAKDVTIESCPTSNVTLAGLSDYGAHPFWEWSKPPYSVDVSISSDDPLHFRNNVLGEVSALLATGRDRQSLRSAVETGLRDCSGGSAKRVAGRRGYARVVDLIEDSLVRN
jgi:hypothetical protein